MTLLNQVLRNREGLRVAVIVLNKIDRLSGKGLRAGLTDEETRGGIASWRDFPDPFPRRAVQNAEKSVT
jgi:hypothetical protein